MPVVLPTSLPPSRDDRTTFAQRGNDAWAHLFAAWPALNTLETNVNAKEVTVNAKELSATTAATNAANSAVTAATSAGAIEWVSGTTYAIGNFRYSPATFAIFRRITAGAGTIDPSADATNWGGIIQPLVSGGTGASTAAAARANLGVGTAALTTFTPVGNLAATTVQAMGAELDTEKANIADVQAQTYTAFTTAGTLTAYTLTPVPAVTAYTGNQAFFVNFHVASGTAPTLAINGIITPPQLVKQNSNGTYSNIAAGDIPAGHRSYVMLISATQALVDRLPQGQQMAQNLTASSSAVATGTTVIPGDDTIPQITEGDQYLSLAITPINANSTLEIEASINLSSSAAASSLVAAMFRDAIANALTASLAFQATATGLVLLTLRFSVVAGSTAATTFRVRAGSTSAGTTTSNGSSGARIFGGALFSTINIKEYLP